MEDFYEKCYIILKEVPRGKITTYKEIANQLNSKAYRAVGKAMNKNPYAPKIPCHRVINSNGNVGRFAFGVENKIRILKKEGIKFKENKIINFKRYLFKF